MEDIMPHDSLPKKVADLRIECPHCGHHVYVTIDPTSGDQDYYDECSACCNDIHLNMHIDEYRQKIELAINSDEL